MDLTLGPEEEAVRDAIRSVLAERLPLSRVRALAASGAGVDEAVWREAGGLGWFGLGLPEAAGGAGYGLPEEMLLFIELGRTLAPGPWLGTVLAAHALAPTWHRDIVAGTRRVAVVDDPGDVLGTEDRLDGSVDGVADAAVADTLLVLGSRQVRWLPSAGPGVTIGPPAGIDPTRRLAHVHLRGAPAEKAAADAAALRRRAAVLVAAEAVGIAERTLESSVAHAKVRVQFGRPIGAFQAVKHRAADMAVRAEVARSVTAWAAVALAEGARDGESDAHVAKALAVDAALANAADNIQNHGGMGFTWEADAHLYLKRAWLLEHTFGTRTDHLDALARRLGGAQPALHDLMAPMSPV